MYLIQSTRVKVSVSESESKYPGQNIDHQLVQNPDHLSGHQPAPYLINAQQQSALFLLLDHARSQ